MNKWYPLCPSAESGTYAESGIRNSNPDSGVWKSSSQINGLLQNPESGISSLTGRCHPLKLGVAPNPEPIWWDDG